MDNIYDEFEEYINLDNTKDTYNTVTKTHILAIDSKDRNLATDTNYNFSINFTSLNTNILNINKNFKNITQIQLIGIIIPNIYVDIQEGIGLYNNGLITSGSNGKHKNLMRISDLSYLLLNISEIKNKDTYGSNNNINKATFILSLDDNNNKTNNNNGNTTISGTTFTENGNLSKVLVSGTDKRVLYLKDMSETPINYYSAPNNYLSNLDISITTPNGKMLSNLNNYLECNRIYKIGDGTITNPYRINITFSKFFCSDEYQIGDKILFKDILLSDNSYGDLKNFLMRDAGHTILELNGKGSFTNTKLYSEIVIPFEYITNFNISENYQGKSTLKSDFSLPNTVTAILNSIDDPNNNEISLTNRVNTISISMNIYGLGIKDTTIVSSISAQSGSTATLRVSLLPETNDVNISFHSNDNNITFLSGKVINLSSQTILSMIIKNEERDENKLHSNII